jgi:hypothetical protein
MFACVLAIFFGTIVYLTTSFHYGESYLSQEILSYHKIDLKIYILPLAMCLCSLLSLLIFQAYFRFAIEVFALTYEFGKHNCTNIDKSIPAIYLNSDHERVLISKIVEGKRVYEMVECSTRK